VIQNAKNGVVWGSQGITYNHWKIAPFDTAHTISY